MVPLMFSIEGALSHLPHQLLITGFALIHAELLCKFVCNCTAAAARTVNGHFFVLAELKFYYREVWMEVVDTS